MKKALITGITGQDGSYLADLLLEKGYEVHGIIRRASTFNTGRIEHLYQDPHVHGVRLFLHYGDLADSSHLSQLLHDVKPDELYHLGSQSHVRVSFDVPEYTGDVTGLATTRILEAIRSTGVKTKFYQASSSEMFGKVQEPIQSEKTPFYPRSPYGCAKVYAYWVTVNYREGYGIHATNGILFNHETITAGMPLIFKRSDGLIDIKPISEIVRDEACVSVDESRRTYQSGSPTKPLEVWDKGGWTRVKFASAYPHDRRNDDKCPRVINARQASYIGTSSHMAIMSSGGEVPFEKIKIGDRVSLLSHPEISSKSLLTKDEALMLGILAGDGWVAENYEKVSVTNSSPEVRKFVQDLWLRLGGTSCSFYPTKSGFKRDKVVGKLSLYGNRKWIAQFSLYNRERTEFGDRTKRVPWQVLNSNPETMREFLRGYNMCDGLKSNPCIYEFRNFKTNSATLAAGLVFLVEKTTRQKVNITVEASKAWGRTALYYSVNLLSDSSFGDGLRSKRAEVARRLLSQGLSQREISRRTGISRVYLRRIAQGYTPPSVHHLAKPGDEVKKIIDLGEYDGWFYDLETESGTFHCGVGFGHVHNSPRRGETFVTRKITRAVARIEKGLQKDLYLGNLDAKRDWGYAKEYVEGMWRMLQQEKADDYVLATGETHSVKEFLEEAFRCVGLEWQKYVKEDPRYRRPTEVDLLIGDASKAKAKLGWEPKTRFKDLVKLMVDADRQILAAQLDGKIPPRY